MNYATYIQCNSFPYQARYSGPEQQMNSPMSFMGHLTQQVDFQLRNIFSILYPRDSYRLRDIL